jgi:hypothetical protein
MGEEEAESYEVTDVEVDPIPVPSVATVEALEDPEDAAVRMLSLAEGTRLVSRGRISPTPSRSGTGFGMGIETGELWMDEVDDVVATPVLEAAGGK